MQVDAAGLDERLIVKTRAAKALTAAVVIGGTLFAVGGTSFAAGTLPNGAAVTATGTGATLAEAKASAKSQAASLCQTGAATGSSSKFQYSSGRWTATFSGKCVASAAQSDRAVWVGSARGVGRETLANLVGVV